MHICTDQPWQKCWLTFPLHTHSWKWDTLAGVEDVDVGFGSKSCWPPKCTAAPCHCWSCNSLAASNAKVVTRIEPLYTLRTRTWSTVGASYFFFNSKRFFKEGSSAVPLLPLMVVSILIDSLWLVRKVEVERSAWSISTWQTKWAGESDDALVVWLIDKTLF